jgi:succinate dehydrogenase (ubiquinone) membrane anchor subunit
MTYYYFTFLLRGTKEILSDYLPEIFSNKAITTTAVYLWTGVSVLTFLGLAYLNIYDVGVCKAVAMLWKL